jgi:hypothetical protein
MVPNAVEPSFVMQDPLRHQNDEAMADDDQSVGGDGFLHQTTAIVEDVLIPLLLILLLRT